MAAIVEVWVGELTKLREKVLPSNSKPLFSKAKQGADQNKKKNVGVLPPRDTSVASDSSTMSEATVCLLMDRFVPW